MCELDVCESFFRREMLSAIMLAFVLIHWELMPSGELINSRQKNLARSWPIFDFLQAPVVQLSEEVLSVTLRRTGYGSSVKFDVSMTWRDAH